MPTLREHVLLRNATQIGVVKQKTARACGRAGVFDHHFAFVGDDAREGDDRVGRISQHELDASGLGAAGVKGGAVGSAA